MLPAPALAADLTPPDSIGTGMPATGRRPPLAHFVLAYWGSEERWRALALLAVILAIMFGSSYLMVWGNELVGDVTDALVNRRWNELGRALVTSVAVSVTATAIAISSVAVTRLLDLGWRSWLTRHLLARWTSANAFYDVEREGVLKNADQRIAEDVRLFAERSLNIFTSFCTVLVQAVTFTVLLWRLSQSVSFELGGRSVAVQGYMVYIAYGYAVVGLLVTHLLGRQLVALNMARQGVEADYRHLGMQLRENAEQIAFYRGGPREHARLGERFEFVRRNFLAIVLRSWKVDLARNMYGNLLRPLPTLAALPLYFGGQVTLGGMTRAVAAFGTLTSVLNYFSQAYVGFTEWLAVTNRLRDLSTALDDAHGRPSGFAVEPGDGPALATGELTLRTPAGRTLAVVAPLRIEPGARWLVHGPSGAGKSTLLRALAGLWPHGGGRITMPCASLPMFLPQRSYIPGGSLKAALCYPADPGRFGDDDCRDALVACGLGALAAQLQAVDDWQHVLSGGEQQRLAFARVLLHRPSLVFLDEATSALDPDAEQQLYRALLAALPAGALVSVTHRESLGALHDHVLELRPAGQTASS